MTTLAMAMAMAMTMAMEIAKARLRLIISWGARNRKPVVFQKPLFTALHAVAAAFLNLPRTKDGRSR